MHDSGTRDVDIWRVRETGPTFFDVQVSDRSCESGTDSHAAANNQSSQILTASNELARYRWDALSFQRNFRDESDYSSIPDSQNGVGPSQPTLVVCVATVSRYSCHVNSADLYNSKEDCTLEGPEPRIASQLAGKTWGDDRRGVPHSKKDISVPIETTCGADSHGLISIRKRRHVRLIRLRPNPMRETSQPFSFEIRLHTHATHAALGANSPQITRNRAGRTALSPAIDSDAQAGVTTIFFISPYIYNMDINIEN